MTEDYDRVQTVARVLGWRPPSQRWGFTPFQESAMRSIWRQACDVVEALYELDGNHPLEGRL